MLLVDLDGFKLVNDTHGHAAGDRLLRETARRLDGVRRDGDMAGRLGGDEFLVLLPGADPSTAEALAAAIRAAVAEPVEIGDDAVAVEASIGYAVRPPGSPNRSGRPHA